MISAGLVLLVLAAFEPLRHNDFVNYDDEQYITKNESIQSGLTWKSVSWAYTTFHRSNWHPLTWLSHILDIELFGLNAVGHHLHNLLLHTLSTILLFLILLQMTGAVWRSAFVAMVFAIHPLRVESVAWAAERKDVLSMLFFMLTLTAYLVYVKRGGLGRYGLVLLCFALGLMSKPMLVTLPFILLLLDFWPLGRIQNLSPQNVPLEKIPGKPYGLLSLKLLIAEKLPLIGLVVISCIITYAAQKSGGGLGYSGFQTRVSVAGIAYIAYLLKIFWPSNLAVLYPYPFGGYPAALTALAWTVLTMLSVVVVLGRNKKPYWVTGWFWYLIALLPVIGFVRIGTQSMADRYTYLPSIGFSIMVVWTAASWLSQLRYRVFIASTLSILLASAMIVCTRTQLAYWKNSVTLYQHTLSATSNNDIIHNNLGWVYLTQNKYTEAAQQFEKAGQIDPKWPLVKVNMAILALHQQLPDKAFYYLQKALEIDPDDLEANNMMAQLLFEQQRLDEAMEYFRKVIKIKPQQAEAYYSMGTILGNQGKLDEAILAYKQAIRYKQNYYKAFNNLGAIMVQQNLSDQAIAYFQQSIKINPDYAPSYRNIGLVLQTQGQTLEAISYFHNALSRDSKDFTTLYNLACSYHEIGKFAEAIKYYDASLQLNPDSLETLSRLAWILATSPNAEIRNPTRAIAMAEKILMQFSPENPDILDTIAAAYASGGQFKKAAEIAQQAIDLANTTGQKEKAGEISRRLQLFKTEKPYYDPLLQIK